MKMITSEELNQGPFRDTFQSERPKVAEVIREIQTLKYQRDLDENISLKSQIKRKIKHKEEQQFRHSFEEFMRLPIKRQNNFFLQENQQFLVEFKEQIEGYQDGLEEKSQQSSQKLVSDFEKEMAKTIAITDKIDLILANRKISSLTQKNLKSLELISKIQRSLSNESEPSTSRSSVHPQNENNQTKSYSPFSFQCCEWVYKIILILIGIMSALGLFFSTTWISQSTPQKEESTAQVGMKVITIIYCGLLFLWVIFQIILIVYAEKTVEKVRDIINQYLDSLVEIEVREEKKFSSKANSQASRNSSRKVKSS